MKESQLYIDRGEIDYLIHGPVLLTQWDGEVLCTDGLRSVYHTHTSTQQLLLGAQY